MASSKFKDIGKSWMATTAQRDIPNVSWKGLEVTVKAGCDKAFTFTDFMILPFKDTLGILMSGLEYAKTIAKLVHDATGFCFKWAFINNLLNMYVLTTSEAIKLHGGEKSRTISGHMSFVVHSWEVRRWRTWPQKSLANGKQEWRWTTLSVMGG